MWTNMRTTDLGFRDGTEVPEKKEENLLLQSSACDLGQLRVEKGVREKQEPEVFNGRGQSLQE